MRAAPRVTHLIVGPEQHGVVRCARNLAEVDGGPIRAAMAPAELAGAWGPAHVHFTDRLFGPSAETAAEAFLALASSNPDGLTVTLHDVPPDAASNLEQRRSTAYAAVTAAARAVVVNSHHEAVRLARISPVRPAVIPLAVDPLPTGDTPASDGPTTDGPRTASPKTDRQVVVLGFVYPGKGHAEVIDALPAGQDLIALGRASDGHDALVVDLQDRAAARGRRFMATGFVADAELPGRLREAGTPVAPNREVSASGSIATWLAAGRRPLVPRSTYTDELEAAYPGTLWRYDDLAAALAEAGRQPHLTWLPPGTRVGLRSFEVVAAYQTFWAGSFRPRGGPC